MLILSHKTIQMVVQVQSAFIQVFVSSWVTVYCLQVLLPPLMDSLISLKFLMPSNLDVNWNGFDASIYVHTRVAPGVSQ